MKIFLFCFILTYPILLFSQGYPPHFVIVQGKNAYMLDTVHTELKLKRKTISIYFISREYSAERKEWFATQIAISERKSDTELIQNGLAVEEIYYFSPGTEAAASGLYECFNNPFLIKTPMLWKI